MEEATLEYASLICSIITLLVLWWYLGRTEVDVYDIRSVVGMAALFYAVVLVYVMHN